MAEPFLSELRCMSFNFAPKGWAMCNGQLMPINQNQALFSLLGTTYGGDGRVNFGLPDLRGRVPIHVGSGFTLGERGGEQSHTLSMSEMPAHQHLMQASSLDGNTNLPVSLPAHNILGQGANVYANPGALVALVPGTAGGAGGSQSHLNMQPFLTLTWCVALQGIFPSPN
jgi:microcystin-dependent protein